MSRGHPVRFREGQRVEFGVDFVRTPDVAIPAGSRGVVDYFDDHLLTVTMEKPIPGLEDSDNQVDFQKAEFTRAIEILKVVTDS